MYNEILPPIIEKQKILEGNELSVYQLLELLQKTLDGMPKTYRCKSSPMRLCFKKGLLCFIWKI